MKKYIVKAGFDPLKSYRPADLETKCLTSGNTGNSVFAYGVLNVLTTNDSMCVPSFNKFNYTDEEIEFINSTYDAYILPLADAFRPSFVKQMKLITTFVKKMKIPVIVIGVGYRGNYEPDITTPRPYDCIVKEFVNAILDHSSCIGLRGEITADYLKFLGYIPERDYTVIGCPSLYTHGMGIEETKGVNCSAIGVNINEAIPAELVTIYDELFQSYNNIEIVQQRLVEIENLYYGCRKDMSHPVTKANYFDRIDMGKLYKENRVKFFINVPDWLEYVKKYSVFIASRFHGAASALLGGVPVVFLPLDARTRELCDYHHVAAVRPTKSNKADAIDSIISQSDFNRFYNNQKANLEHYFSFLKQNDLQSIFDSGIDYPFGSSPLEMKILGHRKNVPVVYKSFCNCRPTEKLRRKTEYLAWTSRKRYRKINSMLNC